jgi:hypothetical protein
MEAVMVRTAFRLILSVLAAATLVSVVAAGPASAQGHWDYGNRMRGSLFPPAQNGAAERPNGLAAKNHSQRSRLTPGSVQKELSLSDDQQGSTTHYEFRWWQDYSSR